MRGCALSCCFCWLWMFQPVLQALSVPGCSEHSRVSQASPLFCHLLSCRNPHQATESAGFYSVLQGKRNVSAHGFGSLGENTGRTRERQFLCSQSPFGEEKLPQRCKETPSLSWCVLQFLTPFQQGFSPTIPTVQSSFWKLLFLPLERQNLSPEVTGS